MFIFDAHSDIWIKDVEERLKGNPGYFEKVHFNKLKCGGVGGSIFVVYTQTEPLSIAPQNLYMNLGSISRTIIELERSRDDITIVYTYDDIEEALKENKFFIILGAEGLSGIGEDINQIATLYRLGLRHASLTWNEKNALAAGAASEEINSGITPLGEKAIKLIEELGMVLDVSHLNEKSFWDVTEIAKKPFIASHSNSKTLCGHRRNITDEQAKAIAKSGGVIGINVCGVFVDEGSPTLDRYLDHIDYMCKLVGVDHVGIGFDFCDFLRDKPLDENDDYFLKQTKGLENISKGKDVLSGLKARGYSQSDIEKIAYKNFLGVFKNII